MTAPPSQTFRNPNVELAAAGLLTLGVAFFHALVGLGRFLNGSLLAGTAATAVGAVLAVSGLGVLGRASWGWTLGVPGYVVALAFLFLTPLDGFCVTPFDGLPGLFSLVSIPVLFGCGLYVLLARDEFKSTDRPEEVRRPFYR